MEDQTPNTEKFNSRIAAVAFGAVLGVLGAVVLYPLLTGVIDNATANNMALTGLGLVGGVAVAAQNWFMRGRVQAPGGGNGGAPRPDAPLVNVEGPSRVEVSDNAPPTRVANAPGALPVSFSTRGMSGRIVGGRTVDAGDEVAEGGADQRGKPGQ